MMHARDFPIAARRRCLALAVALAAVSTSQGVFGAAEYPVRPLRFVVPNTPSGGGDMAVRMITQKLGAAWRQQVVVDNRPGGGSVLGADLVAKAQPDGYTMLLGATSFSINASLRRSLPYDTEKDFAPVVQIATQPHLVVVHPALPVRSIRELIAYARARPGQLNFGSSGAGSGGHLAAELFKLAAGIEMVHIPYKGTAPAMTDLLGGQIHLIFSTILGGMPHVKSERLRAIAVSTARRSTALPDVPTIGESGVPGYESGSWNGILVPARTSPAIIGKLNAELVRILQAPDMREWFARDGAEAVGGTPAAFGDLIRREIVKWRDVVKAQNLQE